MSCKAALAQAQQKLRNQPGVPHTECIVCMDAAVDTVLLPCGHLCLCHECSTALQQGAKAKATSLKCPLCRVSAQSAQRIYLHLNVEKPPPAAAQPRRPNPAAIGVARLPPSAPQQVAPVLRHGAPAVRTGGDARVVRQDRSAADRQDRFQPALVENGAALFSKTLPASFPQRDRDRVLAWD